MHTGSHMQGEFMLSHSDNFQADVIEAFNSTSRFLGPSSNRTKVPTMVLT